MTGVTLIAEHHSFGGVQGFYSHESPLCGGTMRFSVYRPPQATSGKVPVLYYLAGLTCTEENFPAKAGAQRVASELGLMLVAPDTSPRAKRLPGDADAWDFGQGAGFYVDATCEPWAGTYRMYSYVTKELPALIEGHFPANPERRGIFGHSMGGHGALVAALRNPARYRTVSAFAPIVAPMQVPWGIKAFTGYLGQERNHWRDYDASELVRNQTRDWPILIDQGTADKFLTEQLRPEIFEAACQEAGQSLILRLQPGHDHSYYFIASFVEDHLRHHAKGLAA